MANRLITITWNSKFTKIKTEVKPENHVYLADNSIGSTEWNTTYLPHLFNYLLKYHQEWLQNGEVIPETETQQKDNADILNFSDNFKVWLDSEVVQTGKSRDWISFDALKKKLLASEYWMHLQKPAKSIGAMQFLKKELRDRNDTRKWIREQKNINKKTVYFWSLAGHQLREQYDNHNHNHFSGRKRLRSKSCTQEFDELCAKIGDQINGPPQKKHKDQN